MIPNRQGAQRREPVGRPERSTLADRPERHQALSGAEPCHNPRSSPKGVSNAERPNGKPEQESTLLRKNVDQEPLYFTF